MVSWMAGLFYGVRLFIYHVEANEKTEPDRSVLLKEYSKITARLWNIITTPAMVLTVSAGISMLAMQPTLLQVPWMHVKLGFVLLLLCYHFICRKMMLNLRAGKFVYTSTKLRLWNEVATILLVAIVFTVILKNAIDWIFGLIGLLVFAVIIMLAVKWYKAYREKNNL